MPVENMLFSRPFTSLAGEMLAVHGDLPVAEILQNKETLEQLGLKDATLGRLWSAKFFPKASANVKFTQLREPYRREALEQARATAARDIAAIVECVRAGATFYVTPEGDYSRTGRMHRLGAASSTPSFRSPRLGCARSRTIRSRPATLDAVPRRAPRRSGRSRTSLASARPVTTSAVLSAFLLETEGPFSRDRPYARCATA